MKTITLLAFIASITTSILIHPGVAQAECLSVYYSKIAQLQGQQLGPKMMLSTGAAGAVITPVAIIAIGGTLTAAGLIGIPIGLTSSAAYFGALKLKQNSYKKAYRLIQQAKVGEGSVLLKTAKKIYGKNVSPKQISNLANLIQGMDSQNAFCESKDEFGKIKLLGFKKMIRSIQKFSN